MKKLLPLAVFLFAILAPQAFGQTDTMINLRSYAEYFGFQGGTIRPTDRYIISSPIAERSNFSGLAGHERQIDTPLITPQCQSPFHLSVLAV